MKEKINNILIYLAFNIYRIIAANFVISLLGIVLSRIVRVHYIIVDYYFWLSFGLFINGIMISKINGFLRKVHREENDFYLFLLHRKKIKSEKK